jgi:hypothetical protein
MYDGTFTMNFIGYQILSPTNNTLYLRPTAPITGVKNIRAYTDIIRGEKTWQYVKIFFKYQNKYDNEGARCQDCWSDMMPIESITGITCLPNVPFDIEFFIMRVDDGANDAQHPRTNIYFGDDQYSQALVIYGDYEFNYTDGPFTLSGGTEEDNAVILIPKDIYKIFSLSDFQIIADDPGNLDIMYRVTQDNGRTYSKWEPLTKSNISTFRFNNLRFARIEYKVKLYIESDQPNNVYDIILTGNFQNVSANYLKTNRYGIRQDCLVPYINQSTGATDSCGFNIPTTSGVSYGIAPGNGTPTGAMTPYDLNMNFWTQGLSCYSTSPLSSNGTVPAGGVMAGMTAENQANTDTLWKPYDITQIMAFANKLANDVNNIFAWEVDYHLTDPDSNGEDMILHEYQLFNIVDMKKIKVLVPDNKFPDNMIKFNQFSLDLFDTFEIHILKDEFKRKFGITARPSENDILFMCPINRLYYIKHAQVFRDVMNAGYYYKVILEKYEQKANIRNLHEESKALLDTLTKNTTMSELFGPEKKNEEEMIANIEQFKPFTFDPMRYVVNNKVIRVQELITNGNFDVSKSHYDFSKAIGKTAIVYKKTDNTFTESTNRSIICWFNFNNGWTPEKPNKNAIELYNVDQNTNFWLLDNYDETTKTGYRLWYFKKDINFQLNEQYYKLQNVNLLTNIWYSLVINIDQRQQTLSLNLHTRENDYNIVFFNPTSYQVESINWADSTGYTYLISAGYKPVDNQEESRNLSTDYITVKDVKYTDTLNQSFTHESDIEIKGTNIKYTNLRILTDIIPDNEIRNVLNQYYIANAEKVLLADNADRNIYTDNYVNKNWT